MTLYRLTSEMFEYEAKPILERVLCEVPLLGLLPNRNYQERTILFPINFRLSKTELTAVVTAAYAVGDTGFYLSLLERDENPSGIKDLYFSLPDSKNYLDFGLTGIFGVLENVMYSPNGEWSIKFVVDDHAIIGGSSLFINTLFSTTTRL